MPFANVDWSVEGTIGRLKHHFHHLLFLETTKRTCTHFPLSITLAADFSGRCLKEAFHARLRPVPRTLVSRRRLDLQHIVVELELALGEVEA